MADKNTIKNWFKTNLKPTQAQFWALFDSYRHNDEKIPITAIDDIENILADKADAEVLSNHLTNEAAHADLFGAKEDKTNRGAALGYAPLNEFTKLAIDYLNVVNDLVTGGESSLLTAEQGKLLQIQITAINSLLSSNDVNLDNVQELVDAIKTVQTSLSSILVNDLTTGGTTKALTAEMGKTLKGLIDGMTTALSNKVDKVAGERLINAAEITKLAGLGSISTTVKPILSTALATQNVAGFVTYINALTPVLVVGASEIVKYNLTDTGRVFELNLRGRSFGVGQPAIVAADVLEVTEFLNKDLKLSNYPNTRNDGQLPTNKVLSTDANGNLKMYTTAVAPAPYLLILIPDSTSPSTTTNFVLKGAFFTPTMTVVIAGQTINYITFISDNEVRVNVTTGAAEGMFSVTLNNGIQAIFNNALLIVLGTVFTPKLSEWGSISGNINLVTDGYAKVSVFDSVGSGTWDKVIDNTKNYSIRFELALTPLGAFTQGIGSGVTFITLLNSSDLTTRYTTQIYNNSGDIAIQFGNQVSSNLLRLYGADFGSPSGNAFAGLLLRTYEFRKIGSNMFVYIDNVLKYSFIPTVTENLLLKVSTRVFDVKSIKYIELV